MTTKKTTTKENEKTTAVEKKTTAKKTTRKTTTRKTTTRRKKTVSDEEIKQEEQPVAVENIETQETATNVEQTENTSAPSNPSIPSTPSSPSTPTEPKPVQKEVKAIPELPQIRIRSIVDLINAPQRQILLSDQQIQQLTLEEANQRFRFIEGALAWVLNYDVVITDTNIWLELLVGHTSSHSDPKVNARLLFERQLEFISKLVRFRKAHFLMMSETYEEIDRFASAQAPTNYKDADFNDEAVCRNIAARLAKRLILSQQRENRLRIEGITSESHHAAFADPAIIRRTVELFAQGQRVLVITNDASVGIRSIGMCDDLQRTNNIDDETWENVYTPLRPMVFTMDDLKVLDNYTRQLHFLQMAAGKQWMEDVPQSMAKSNVAPLNLWKEGFRPGDKHAESKNSEQQKQPQKQQRKDHKPQQKKAEEPVAKEETNVQAVKEEAKPEVKQPAATVTAEVSQPQPSTDPVPLDATQQDPAKQPQQKKRTYRRPQRRKKSEKENQ